MTQFSEKISGRVPYDIPSSAMGYALIVIVISWPLATSAGTAIVDPTEWATAPVFTIIDVELLMWILSWTAHALLTQPLEIFQGNIFHPAPDSLAFSEHLLGLLPVSGPIFWTTENPVLTYNVTTLAVVWMSAFSMFLMVRSFSGSAAAGFFAGCLFAFGGNVSLDFLRLHTSAIHFYPLVLLLMWVVAETGRKRAMIALFIIASLQALSGVYVAFGLGALSIAALPFVLAHARRSGQSAWAPLLPLILATLPLGIIAGAYLRVRSAGFLPDPIESVALLNSTSPRAGFLFQTLADELTVVGIILSITGMMFGRLTIGIRPCLVAVGIMGFTLALGTNATLPGTNFPSLTELLGSIIPGFSAMRAPMRFLYLTQLSLTAFAGIGLARLASIAMARWPARTTRFAPYAFLLVSLSVVAAKVDHWPLTLSDDPLAEIYVGSHRWLAEYADPGPVLDLPVPSSSVRNAELRSNGRAMLGSTLHWFPLLNGYTGHPPESYLRTKELARRLPQTAALQMLCVERQIRWIVVHHGILPSGSETDWKIAESRLPINAAHKLGKDTIYEVDCLSFMEKPPESSPSS